jgi:hypothetical protein
MYESYSGYKRENEPKSAQNRTFPANILKIFQPPHSDILRTLLCLFTSCFQKKITINMHQMRHENDCYKVNYNAEKCSNEPSHAYTYACVNLKL